MINLVEVKSSNIMGIGHDPESQTLHVKFIGGNLYEYKGVSKETFEAFSTAESKGKFFSANIRGKFEFKKVVPEAK